MGNPIRRNKASQLRTTNEANNNEKTSELAMKMDIPKKINLEGQKINMNENLLWRFVKVNGKYEPAEVAHYVFYENGRVHLKVHEIYYEVSKKEGEIYLTQRRRLKRLAKSWKIVGTTPISFIDIIPNENETEEEAMQRVLPDDLYQQAMQLPPGVSQDVF